MVSQDYPESPKEVQPEVVADRALQEYLAIPEILQAASEYPGNREEPPGCLEANQPEVLVADWALQEYPAILPAASAEHPENRDL